MQPLSAETVEATWQEIAQWDPAKFPPLIQKMSSEQPGLLAYLMACGEDIFNQSEKELVLYIGVVVWQIMSKGGQKLPKVTVEQLEKAEEKNFMMLEDLVDESEGDFIAVVDNTISNYNQLEVLHYVVEAIMEDEEEVEIDEDNKGYMLIFLKTVIDCLDS